MAELSNKKRQFRIDIAFVVDATGSMQPLIPKIKYYANNIYRLLKNNFSAAEKTVKKIRLKLIEFADFKSEGKNALKETRFYEADKELKSFVDQFDLITTMNNKGEGKGGNELPENALEALWLAMNSDWTDISPDEDGRHIIMLFTDSSPLDFYERAKYANYMDYNFPSSIDELREAWGKYYGGELKLNNPVEEKELKSETKYNPKYARLFLFAPRGEIGGKSWNYIFRWERVTQFPVVPYESGVDLVAEEIVYDLVHTD